MNTTRTGRVNWLRVCTVCFIGAGAMLASFAILPLPPGLEAATLCYPIVGPVTRVAPSLVDSARVLTLAHEAEHARQCRELGALGVYARQVIPSSRAKLELEAFCAEARVEWAWGRDGAKVRARILDELHDGYRWFRQLPQGQIATTFDAMCTRRKTG